MKILDAIFKIVCGCSLVFLSGCNNGGTGGSTTGGDYEESSLVSTPLWHQIKTPDDTGTIGAITAHAGKFFIGSYYYNNDSENYSTQLYMTRYGVELGAHPESNPAWTHIYFTDYEGNDRKVNQDLSSFVQLMVAPAIKNGQYIESTNYLYFSNSAYIGAVDFTYDESNIYESSMVRNIIPVISNGDYFLSFAYQESLGIYTMSNTSAQTYASMSTGVDNFISNPFYNTSSNCNPYFPSDASNSFTATDANGNVWLACGNNKGSGNMNLYVCSADKTPPIPELHIGPQTVLGCTEADTGGFIASVVADDNGFVYVSWVDSSSLITYYYNKETSNIYTKAIKAPGSTERMVVDNKHSVLVADFSGNFYTYNLANISDIETGIASLQQVGNNIPALNDIQNLALDSRNDLLFGYNNDNKVFWFSLDKLKLNPISSAKK